MRPHQLTNRRNVISLSLLASAILGATFMYAPMQSVAAARQALAARLNASPTAQRIMSIAPAPVRTLVRRQFEPVTVVSKAAVAPISTMTLAEAGVGGTLGVASTMTVASFTQTVLTAQPVCAGTNVQYSLVATNDATADTGDTLSFSAPVGWTFVTNSLPGPGFTTATCGTGPANNITCTGVTLPAGAVGTLNVTFAIPGTQAAGIYPPASAGSYTAAVPPGATGSADVTVQRCLGVTITKGRVITGGGPTGGPDNAIAGFNSINYTISITNNGPSEALPGEFTATDVLSSVPAIALTPGAAAGTFNPACGAALFAAGCSNSGNIPNGASRTITFSVPVPANGAVSAAECTAIDNDATVNSTAAVTNAPQSADAADVFVVQRGLFDIDNFTDTPGQVYAGQTFTYNFDLQREPAGSNPSIIYGGNVTLQLPIAPVLPGGTIAQLVSSTPPAGWTCAPPNGAFGPTMVVCTPPATGIPAGGGSHPFMFVVRTNSLLANGTILSATASWNPPAAGNCDTGLPGNPGFVTNADSETQTTEVITSADLGINKTAAPAAVIAGDLTPAGIITYTLTLGNNPQNEPGSDAVNVSILDNVPGNVVVVGQPVWTQLTPPVQYPAAVITVTCAPPATAGAQFVCTPTGNTGINPSYVNGVLPKGVTGRIVYTVRVPAGVTQGSIIGNAASINSNTQGQVQNTPDPNSGNNVSLTTSTLVNAVADLVITKTVPSPPNIFPINAGQFIQYSITATNNGPSDARNVVISDVIGGGLVFQAITPGTMSCVTPIIGQPGPVSCTQALLTVGASTSIVITARVIPSFPVGPVFNTATAQSDQSDPTFATSTTSVAVSQLANLIIQKFVSPNPVVAGGLFTYQIRVINPGPSNAVGVVVTDSWAPLQGQFVSATGTNSFSNPGACVDSGPPAYTVTCTPGGGTLPAGPVNDIFLTFRLNPDATCPQPTGPVGNFAHIVTTTPGNADAPGLDSNQVFLNVVRQPDLQITKTDTPDPVNAGNNLTYQLTIKNNGISTALAGEVSVTDPLPAQTTGVSASGTGVFAGCTLALLTGGGCTNSAAMAPGAQETITYVVKVNANFSPVPGLITNTATVAVNVVQPCPPSAFAPEGPLASKAAQLVNGDPNLGNNVAIETTTVSPGADLAITKTAETIAGAIFGATVFPGGTIAGSLPSPVTGTGEILYTLTYRNNGPSDAANVHLRDVIPAGTLLDPTFLPIGVVVTPAAGPGLTCQVLPTLITYQLDCTPNTPGGVLPNGANGTIMFRVRVPENVPTQTAIKNQATINSEGLGVNPATPDQSSGNNTSQETQNITRAVADLAITKAGPPTVNAGAQIVYTLTLTNNGPSNAQDVVVKDTLPAGVSFVSAISSNAAMVCGHAGGVVTCQLATLIAPPVNPPPLIPPQAGSNTATITITGLVSPGVANGTILNNSATINSTTEDPAPGNNTSNVVATTVTSTAALSIVKVASPNPVVAGNNLTYTITLTNNGPSDATGVVVTDPLPAETSFVSAVGTGVFSPAGSCTFAAGLPVGTVTCNATPGGILPATPPNNTATITIVVKVLSGAVGPNIGPNVATVNWTNGGAASPQSSAAVNVVLARVADLQLDKTCAPTTIAGQNIDCTIKLKNAGPSDIKGGQGSPGEPPIPPAPGSVVLTDILPTGSGYVSATIAGAGGFTCTFDPATFTVTCLNSAGDSGNIPAGGETTIIIKSTTPANAPAGSNSCDTARVAINNTIHPDPDPVDPIDSNNTDVACAVVQRKADLEIVKSVLLPAPPAGVAAGAEITYRLLVRNNGPSHGANVLVTDILPGNTTFVPGSIVYGGGNTAFLGVACAYNAPIPSAPNGSVSCIPQPTVGPPATVAGELRPSLTYETIDFRVLVNASVAAGTLITNVARIDPPAAPDPNPENNTSLATSTVVLQNSVLDIAKAIQSATYAPDPPYPPPNTNVVPGTLLTYRLTLTNNGLSDASQIVVRDTLPARVKYVGAVQTGGFGSIFTCFLQGPPDPQGFGGVVQCTTPSFSGVAPNNVATIDVTVFIDPATKSPLVNNATISGIVSGFQNPVSDVISLTTGVGPVSDLVLTKSHAPDPVIAGTQFDYTIRVTNNGPSSAAMPRLTDTLPPFQTVVGAPNLAGAPGWSCIILANVVTCDGPTLPPNKNQDNSPNPAGTIVIGLRMLQDQLTPQPVPTFYDNCVLLQSMSFDPTRAGDGPFSSALPVDTVPDAAGRFDNAGVCDRVNIGFVADPDTVTLKKVDVPDPVIAGNLLTYTITATNNGPSAALDFRISDTLPASLLFVSAVASPGATLVSPAVGSMGGLVQATWNAAGGTPGGLTAVGVQRILTIVTRVCANTLCGTISNTATSSSLTPDGRVDNNSDTATTTVQTQSDLSITKTDSPDPVKPSFGVTDSNITYTINFANAGPSNSANTIITDVLPAGFTIVSLNSTIPGTVFNTSVGGPEGDQVTVTANVGVLGAPVNQCTVPARPSSGTITIVARVPNKFPNSFVTNTATIANSNCLPDPNPANNTAIAITEVSQEPQGGSAGLAWPAISEGSDDKSGSVLFFPLYTSNASVPSQQNTSISITNTGIFDRATIHLFVVDGSTCAASDVFICLTPNQTVSFLASDFDPGVTGYIVAVAVNANTGRPIAFNCLVGDAYVKYSSGHKASYGAYAVSTLLANPAGVDPLSSTALLRFDGTHYNRLPRILALDNLSSLAEGNSTRLTLMAIGGNMSLSGARIGSLTGNLFDDRENNYSWNQSAPGCIFSSLLSDNFPRTFVPFSGVVNSGHSGWMKIRAFGDIPLLGVALNTNPNSGTSGSAFNNGRMLHSIALTDTATLTIPVDIPECAGGN